MGMYVIQVMGGRERHVLSLIEKYMKPGLIKECFIARHELVRREGGAWHKREEILLPGYLFVECDDPSKVANELRGIPSFARMLGNDDVFIPLAEDEVRWIDKLSSPDDRVIRMSKGVIEEGGRAIVTEGPLKGYEADIKKIDRHKRVAWLDMHILGKMRTIKVGLEIVAKAK